MSDYIKRINEALSEEINSKHPMQEDELFEYIKQKLESENNNEEN